jgi:cytochrome c-type biogenesis protein
VTPAVALLASTDQVADGALVVSMVIAFAAGILSFLSPCVLPLVPVYLSFITGLSAADLAVPIDDSPTDPVDDDRIPAGLAPAALAATTTTATTTPTTAITTTTVTTAAQRRAVRRRVVIGSLGFVLGTSVVFVSFGAVFGSFGDAMRVHAVGLSQIFGVLTILLGLLMAGVFDRLSPLQRDVRIHQVPGHGLAAAPLLGFAFALGWTPCIGPTLGTVLGLSASTNGTTAGRGALLSVAYCLGLGIPLLISGLAFTRAMETFAVIKRHYRALMVAGGAGLVVLGVLQVTGVWAAWTSELQTRFGSWELPL